jgi:hypothetical protein
MYGSITVKTPRGGIAVYRGVAALEQAIKAKKSAIEKMKAERKKLRFFNPKRRALLLAIYAEKRLLAVMERALKVAKKGGRLVVRPKDVQSGALTAAQVAAIQAMIQQMTASGADADQAEEAAKVRVLPPHLLRAVPRGFFRGVRRAGPRPALPTFREPSYAPMPGELPGPTRDIDPLIRTRGIDPIVRDRSIDPMPLVRSIDPAANNIPLLPGLGPQAGSFTFPPGNISDVDPDTIQDVEGLSGVLDTVKEYAAKPWVMGLALLGAVVYGPKLLRKVKGGMKKNPRHNRRRRSRRSRR